ncbi:MAG TPA: LysR family transcriptional regulator [Sphingomicrobium sp.]|nr:LysR family transcriptional regulator [Sphingomicrobium sp.]
MDINAARTFLEIVKAGSFVRAAANLNLTQTAVSARIRVLEDELDRALFIRNKAGARLTAAGEQFLKYATTLVQVWERAHHEVGMPAGRENVLAVGAEYRLWNPLIRDWLIWMRNECPDVAIRAHIGLAEELVEKVQDGVVDLAVVYAPPQRPGVLSELLLDEKLVAVSTESDRRELIGEDYVYVDWGRHFGTSHHAVFPDAPSPVLTVDHGPLAIEYLLAVGGAAYLRMGAARPYLESGRLHLVSGTPSFSYSVHAVYSAKADERVMDRSREGLRVVAQHPMKR